MTKEEIDEKIKALELEAQRVQRIIKFNLCPSCGKDLIDYGGEDSAIELGCMCEAQLVTYKCGWFGRTTTEYLPKIWKTIG